MKKLRAVLAVVSFYLLSFVQAYAHVKWFVDSDEIIKEAHEGTIYDLDSSAVWIWVVVILLMVFLARYLDKVVATPKKLQAFAVKHEIQINKAGQFLLGVFMLVTINFFWSTIITPLVPDSNIFKYWIQLLQALIGLMFMFNIYPRVASILLIGFCVGVGIWSGPVTFFENFLLLAIAIYFFVKNSKEGSRFYKFNPGAVSVLRVCTGLCLVFLAFTEKLAYPELSAAFLHIHNWNFMQPMFPSFSDNIFILSVGASEVLFGVLFVMGYLTRITTLALAVFLISSATSMFVSIGDWEAGHVVIYAAALIFLAFGSGGNKFLSKK